jgi:fermentation-respiration switch protein FrsA (DUF1100 family)
MSTTSWRQRVVVAVGVTPRGFAAAVFTRTPAGRAYMRRVTGTRVSPHWESSGVPTAQVKRVDVPVAVVHGRQDPMIRCLAAVEVYDAASEPRRIELVDGMGHAFCPGAVGESFRVIVEQRVADHGPACRVLGEGREHMSTDPFDTAADAANRADRSHLGLGTNGEHRLDVDGVAESRQRRRHPARVGEPA